MHILGLANGTIGGNSEILLKAALLAAQQSDSSITISWIHVPSVSIPRNPRPMKGFLDISGEMLANIGIDDDTVLDDRSDVLNAIIEADALLIASPVYNHQPAGTLKLLFDRIGGPFIDVSFVKVVTNARKLDPKAFPGVEVDKRIMKPRVAGFMAVAGSPLSDQSTMALPTSHQFVFPMHVKVVDQWICRGFAAPGAVLLKKGNIERAQRVGQNVASQIGKPFDEVQYLGPDEEGNCPYCHLSKLEIEFTKGNDVGCITCGARGKLVVGEGGVIRPIWEEKSGISSLTMAGKLKHGAEIANAANEEIKVLPSIASTLQHWYKIEIPKVSLPSQRISKLSKSNL